MRQVSVPDTGAKVQVICMLESCTTHIVEMKDFSEEVECVPIKHTSRKYT
jgi:hypothetical protein